LEGAVDPGAFPAADQAPPAKPSFDIWPSTTIPEVRFEKTALSDVVDFLRATVPKINFVVTPDAADYTLPPMQLRSVTLSDLARAIDIATSHDIVMEPVNETMLAITRRVETKHTKRLMTFNLRSYFQNKTDDEILKGDGTKAIHDALKLCWSMLDEANGYKGPQPNISIHVPTRTLIVVADDDHLAVADRFLNDTLRFPTAGQPSTNTSPSAK
jgi:hypothetical protein